MERRLLSREKFHIMNEEYNQWSARYVKRKPVSSEQESLSDFVRRVIRDKRLTYRQVAARSGGRLGSATVSDIINNRRKNITTETLVALAAGLQVSEQELFAKAAGLAPPKVSAEGDFGRLFEKSEQLDAAGQEFVHKTLLLLERWVDDELEKKEARRA
jgi:transcriptional regulator with XRE-family HTH domain